MTELPPARPLGVLSDTHDNVAVIRRALDIFRDAGVETLLHAGDIVSLATLELFLGFELYFVRGNNDPALSLLQQKAEELKFHPPDKFLQLELHGKRIFLTHGDDVFLFREVTAAGNPHRLDYLIKGHTHMPEDYRRSEIRILNPGPLYRSEKYTVGLFWPKQDRWQLVEIEK